jgi:F-type H+-transporting ATPase subunit delta
MTEFVTLARPYAKAAFDYAKSVDQVDAWLQHLAVSAGLASVPEIADSFTSPVKNNEVLVSLLGHKDADEGYENFLKLLADNNRLSLLPDVLVLFKFINEQDAKVLSADVFTAEKLDREQLTSIASSLSKRTNKNIKLQQHIDKSLLGGVRIQAGDLVIDGSLKAKLEKLKTELLN